MNYKLLFLIIITLLIQVIINFENNNNNNNNIIILNYFKEQNCSQVCTYYIRNFYYYQVNSTICEYYCCTNLDTTTPTLDKVCCFPTDNTWLVWFFLALFGPCFIFVPFCFCWWRSIIYLFIYLSYIKMELLKLKIK